MWFFPKILKIFLKIPNILKIFSISCMLCLSFSMARAVETVFWVDAQTGVAMAGYDPISYFIGGRGARGSRNYEYFWQGAVWRFVNEGNLTAFRDNPLIYAPQFGGFDATKMADNIRVSPDPQFGDLFENRLYLFHSQANLNEWLDLKSKHVKAAQKNWMAQYVYGINKNFVVRQIEQDDILSFALADSGLTANSGQKEEVDEQSMVALTPLSVATDGASGNLDSISRLGAAGAHFKKQR